MAMTSDNGLDITITNVPRNPAICPWGRTDIVIKDPKAGQIIEVEVNHKLKDGGGKYLSTVRIKDVDDP